MTTTAATQTWLNNMLAAGTPYPANENNDWLEHVRQQGQHELLELPLPARKQEAWRYTSIAALSRHAFVPSAVDFNTVQQDDIPAWLNNAESIRLVLINGHYVEHLSSLSRLPDGLEIDSMRSALSNHQDRLHQWFNQSNTSRKDVFTSLNTALMNDGLFIHASKHCEVTLPIEIISLTMATDKPILVQPRNMIVLETGARMSLVERFSSTDQSIYFNNGVSDVMLGPDAQLEHTRLQEESRQAYHMQQLNIKQNRDSRYQHTAISLGAAWSRNDIQVSLTEAGAQCHLDGLYTVGDQQLNDFHLNVRHQAPHCNSQAHFKGVLHGKGRGVFDGAIVVAQDAQKTDAHLSNKNLLLCADAEIDTKPQLEIYADDVKCSHGTTVGQIEPEQIFYLRSRGIDEQQARNMISLGFAREILENIDLDVVRDYADQQLSNLLSQTLSSNRENE